LRPVYAFSIAEQFPHASLFSRRVEKTGKPS
jgi:hypothetical protein